MASIINRVSTVAPYLAAAAQTVPSSTKPVVTAIVQKAFDDYSQPSRKPLSSHSYSSNFLPKHGWVYPRATSGISSPVQVRLAHSDVKVPDFNAYRRESVKKDGLSSTNAPTRNAFTYLLVAGGAVPAAYAAKTMVTSFVHSMSASADVLALAKIEVKLSDIPEGKNATLKWRGKPLFIRHRTSEEIERERAVDITSLRDQQTDEERATRPEWLILIGVCTHLGCVPIANAGEYGGYYCPCHGSHYDASGRIRKGPAPLNLEIPDHEYPDDDNVIVG